MSKLLTGTITFLFTDIEGSTRLLQRLPNEYGKVLEDYARLVRMAVEKHGGTEVSTEGDSFFCVFPDAAGAIEAAVTAQQALANHSWPGGVQVRVRMGLHTGQGRLGGDDYAGLDVNRTARIAAAGHGGQVLVSEATRTLAARSLPPGVSVHDLGQHRLKDLVETERLYQLVIPGLESEFPPLRTLSVPHNLPVQLTPFIGREQELAEAARLLKISRLVTLTGAGGIGKTRLALQLAEEAAPEFPDGVFFVPLAPVRDAQFVFSTIAGVLRVRVEGERTAFEVVAEYLADKRSMLVLDNFEQVREAAGEVAALLQEAPSVTCLVTSRAPLRVSGEQEFPVPPLRTPDPRSAEALEALAGYEAVRLFLERATAVNPSFHLTEENAPVVGELTARLEGLPLAVELAAARVKLLSPRALLERLDRRLSLLTGGPRDLPARQRTLRDTIAWSSSLLDEPTRRLFRRLAVFHGGASLDEIEAVVGSAEELGAEVLDALAALVDHSLLRHDDAAEDRFRMLETIREFAEEQLEESGEAPEIRRRHADAYLALAERAEPALAGGDPSEWLRRLQADNDNLRAALGWARAHHPDVALRIAASLWRFWQFSGQLHEAREWLSRVLALEGGSAAARGKAVEAAGGVAYWQGRLDEARAHYEDSLAIYQALNDEVGEANALYNVSFLYAMGESADPDKADASLNKSLELFQRQGDAVGVAKVLYGLGNVSYWARADYDRARTFFTDSIERFRDLDQGVELLGAIGMLNLTLLKLGDLDGVRRAAVEGLKLAAEAGDVSNEIMFLDNFRQLAAVQGAHERALRLYGATSALRRSSGTDHFALEVDPTTLAGDLSEETIEALIAEGESMSLQEAVIFALGRDPADQPSSRLAIGLCPEGSRPGFPRPARMRPRSDDAARERRWTKPGGGRTEPPVTFRWKRPLADETN